MTAETLRKCSVCGAAIKPGARRTTCSVTCRAFGAKGETMIKYALTSDYSTGKPRFTVAPVEGLTGETANFWIKSDRRVSKSGTHYFDSFEECRNSNVEHFRRRAAELRAQAEEFDAHVVELLDAEVAR